MLTGFPSSNDRRTGGGLYVSQLPLIGYIFQKEEKNKHIFGIQNVAWCDEFVGGKPSNATLSNPSLHEVLTASLGRNGDRVWPLGGIAWNSKSLTSATLTGKSSSKTSAWTDGSFFKITTGLELRKQIRIDEWKAMEKRNRCTYSLVDDLVAAETWGLPPSFNWRSMKVRGPFPALIDRLVDWLVSELGRTTSFNWLVFARSSVETYKLETGRGTN